MNRVLVVVSVLVLSGCARNGVLDLDVVLTPGATSERPYALIEVTDIDGNAEQWMQPGFSSPGARSVEVDAGEPIRFSVLGEDPSTEVSVRVRYCRTLNCDHALDRSRFPAAEPGYRFTFERSIWIGRRTSYTLVVGPPEDEVGTVAEICRCQVLGCNSGVPSAGEGVCVGAIAECDDTAPHPCDLH